MYGTAKPCFEKGRMLTDRELVHASLRNSLRAWNFYDQRNLYTLTSLEAYGEKTAGYEFPRPQGYHRAGTIITDADIDYFLDTPLGKKCCRIVRADDLFLRDVDWYHNDTGNWGANLNLRKWGKMRAYVWQERRVISVNSDGTLRRIGYEKYFAPVGNCGEAIKPRERNRSWFYSGIMTDQSTGSNYVEGNPYYKIQTRIGENDYLPVGKILKLFSFYPFIDEPIEEGKKQ
jgi:hypothetical protein